MADALNVSFGGLFFPSGAFSASTFVLGEDADAMEFMFEVDADGLIITRLGFLTTTPNGSSVTWQISLQGVDSSGNPDGTIKGGGSPASATFNGGALTPSEFNWITLNNPYTAAAGEQLAIVIARSSGSASPGTQDLPITHTGTWTPAWAFPYAQTNDVTLGRQRVAGLPVFGYGTSTTAYGFPHKGSLAQTFNSASSPSAYGLGFNIPSGWCATYKVKGFRITHSPPTTGSNTYIARLYDAAANILQERTVNDNVISATGVRTQRAIFPTSPYARATLNAGQDYYLIIHPQQSVNRTFRGITFTSADDRAPWPLGTNAWAASLTGTTFTPITTARPWIDLIFEDITKPSGGGIFSLGGWSGGFDG